MRTYRLYSWESTPRFLCTYPCVSIVSGASPWRTSSTASTTTRTLCDSKESVPNLDSSPDPVISRIRRDFERKQEFLRTTNLPNYLGSPTHPQQPVSASVQARTAPPPPPHAGRCSICHFWMNCPFIFVYKIKETALFIESCC